MGRSSALGKPLLIAAMTGWTLVTAASGCWAIGSVVRDGGELSDRVDAVLGATAVAGARTATPDAARTSIARSATPPARTGTPSVRSRTPASGDTPTAVATATNTAAPRIPKTPSATATPRSFPPPQYVQSASGDPSASELGPGGPATSRDAALAPNRGVVILDPGHGRGDPGAVHYNADGSPAVLEADSNLRNAVLIRDELAALGYDVYLTRDGAGRGPNGPLVQQFISSDLLWRAQLAAAVDADVYLALHGNGATVTSLAGPETWYCGKHEQSEANARLAVLVQQATMNALHEYGYFPPNRGVVEDAERHHSGDFCQFVVTRETVVPSALLEFLFLSNAADARVLADDRSHVILARHVAAAIDQFLSERPH